MAFVEKSPLPHPLEWIEISFSADFLNNLLCEHSAKYHKTCYSRYNAQKLKRKASEEQNLSTLATSKSKRKSSTEHQKSIPECAFCGENEKDLSKMTPEGKRVHRLHAAGELHSSSNKANAKHVEDLTSEWRKMASELGEISFLSKLDADVRANELFYHGNCLKSFNWRHKQITENYIEKENSKTAYLRAVALEKSIRFLKELSYEHPDCPVEVSRVMDNFNYFLKREGFPPQNQITRFGNLILEHSHDEFSIDKNKHGRNVFILKKEFVKATAAEPYFDSSVRFLKDAHKVVTTIRSLIGKTNLKFDVTFDQVNSVQQELISLVGMLIEDNCSPKNASQSILSVAQMIVYNFKKSTRKEKETCDQNISKNQLTKYETPVVSYISLKLYSSVRSKHLVQKLHEIGICVSYDRVVQLLTGWANTALQVYNEDNKVIPLNLRKFVFTVFTKDNIDKNSSSNTSTKHFHGTSICAFQCLKYPDDGVQRDRLTDISDFSGHEYRLPSSYTDVTQISANVKSYSCPVPTVNIPDFIYDDDLLNESRMQEIDWFEVVISMDSTLKKSWSSYHSNLKQIPTPVPCNKSIFPLLKDVVHTLEMQHHLISIFIDYTKTLNPEQGTAVDCSDQPIYALSKINQWLFPKFSLPKYLPLFGGLHIEKTLLVAHGKLIAGSGLEELLGDMEMDTTGLKTASLDVNHIHKGNYAIQLSSVAIYTCLKTAHERSKSEISLFEWASNISKENLMFKYWFVILNLQIDYLVYIKSLREGNFLLFVNILKSLDGFLSLTNTTILDGSVCIYRIC